MASILLLIYRVLPNPYRLPNQILPGVHKLCTVEPPIVDPPKLGHCIINLSTKDTVRGPKNYMPYSFSTFREDNLSIKDKTAEFILSPTCPLFRGSTVTDFWSILIYPARMRNG